MAYTGNPADSALDRIRLAVGDTLPQPILDDDTYQWLLDKYQDNETRAAIDAAQMILFNLTRYVRERTGDIEVYGGNFFDNYRDALMEWLRNPNLSSIVAMPYAGGISVSDMQANNDNPDNVKRCAVEDDPLNTNSIW